MPDVNSNSLSYRQLSFDQRKYARAADMPQRFRDAALFGDFPSLNNGDRRFHPVPASYCVSGPATILRTLPQADIPWTPTEKRDYILHLAREFGLRHLSSNVFDFIHQFKVESLDIHNIQDNGFNPFRRHNYMTCTAQKTHGRVGFKDQKIVKKQRFRCSESVCPTCRDDFRRRIALDHHTTWTQLIDRHPGLGHISDITFTLPQEIENLPLLDPSVAKKLKNAAHALIRRAFGLPKKSNLGVIFADHPVGDSDLFRDRWHMHSLVLPGVVERKKDRLEFRAVEPIHVSSSHTCEKWSFDVNWIREEWTKAVNLIFNAHYPVCLVNVSVFGPSPAYYKDSTPADSRGRFLAQLYHKLKYNTRGFWKDFENQFLRVDTEKNVVIFKIEKKEKSGWVVVPVGDVVTRYKSIKDANKISVRGFLQCLDKYASALDIIGAIEEATSEPEDVDIWVDADVEIIKRKVFCPKTKAFRWAFDEVYRFIDPYTGQEREERLRDVKQPEQEE